MRVPAKNLMAALRNELGKRFATRGAESRFDRWSMSDYALMPLVKNMAFLGPVGALGGAAANPDDRGEGALAGLGVAAGLGVGVPYAVAGRRITQALVAAIRQSNPRYTNRQIVSALTRLGYGAPDEVID